MSDLRICRALLPKPQKPVTITVMISTDFLVLGSGIAGLFFAIKASRYGEVYIVTKKSRSDSNTNHAQGGIACVLNKEDSFESHITDTLTAGAGLCHRDIVEMVVKEGPDRINDLIRLGTNFTPSSDSVTEYDLGREGGHSKRRILHAGDFTGREIEKTLLDKIKLIPNIKILENNIAIDLLIESRVKKTNLSHDRCLGAYILDEDTGKVQRFVAKFTILATGGAGQVYLHTTNPAIATGDGVAMAYRAGAKIINMEFFQFHPTALYQSNGGQSFLISEAVRGEGGILRLPDGTAFMERYHPLKDLAPRDIVARAIDAEMKKLGLKHVYLDVTHLPQDFLPRRFPQIYEHCISHGIDLTTDFIPVVPSAHYMCGGVWTDSSGETSLGNLFAIGEAAGTGLHGANRLASNSLLEAVVFANATCEKCGRDIKAVNTVDPDDVAPWKYYGTLDPEEMVVIRHNWDEIKRLMWNYVGIVRTDKRLERAKRRIDLLKDEITEYYHNFKLIAPLIELRNMVNVADLIIVSAAMRKESRGLHYNLDYPFTDDITWSKDTTLFRKPGGYL
jgi:L-aspartate oxidase